jgi:oligopeptide transport system ATP-binding protein
VKEIFANPQHPYTQALLRPSRQCADARRKLQVIEGQPPILYEAPVACPFRNRCQFAFERCSRKTRRWRRFRHRATDAACFLGQGLRPEPEAADG